MQYAVDRATYVAILDDGDGMEDKLVQGSCMHLDTLRKMENAKVEVPAGSRRTNINVRAKGLFELVDLDKADRYDSLASRAYTQDWGIS